MDERQDPGPLDETRFRDAATEAAVLQPLCERLGRDLRRESNRDVDVSGEPGDAVENGGARSEEVPRNVRLAETDREVGQEISDG